MYLQVHVSGCISPEKNRKSALVTKDTLLESVTFIAYLFMRKATFDDKCFS